MKVQIVKRDGTPEKYDPQKIERVVEAAGLNPEEAKILSGKVTNWLVTNKKEKITSLEIRDQVIKELEAVDEYAANLFKWYQKVKTKNGN